MTTVTLVTDTAGRADSLSEQDYRDIYSELRERRSLAEFVALTASTVSRAWWSQYEAGAKRLDWQRRNELRRAVGLPELAPPVAAALADVASDATIWQVGAGQPDTVILITPELPSGALLGVNGAVHIVELGNTPNALEVPVTPVTFDAEATPQRKRSRPPAHRPYIVSDAKWRAYLDWSRQYDAQEEPTP